VATCGGDEPVLGLFVVQLRDFEELKAGDFVDLVDELSELVDLGSRLGKGKVGSDKSLDFFFDSSVNQRRVLFVVFVELGLSGFEELCKLKFYAL